MEITFHSNANKTHFYKKGCAPSLILKVRVLELGSGILIFCFQKSSRVHVSFSLFSPVHMYSFSNRGMDIGLKLFSKICSFELSCLIRKFVLTSNSFASWFNISEPLRPVRFFHASIFGSGKSSRTNFVLIWKKARTFYLNNRKIESRYALNLKKGRLLHSRSFGRKAHSRKWEERCVTTRLRRRL